MSDFILGFTYSVAGFRLIFIPGIRRYLIVPFLINTILFSLIIIYGAGEISELVIWLEAKWEWLSWIQWLIWPLFIILVLTLVFFCFVIVANLIGSPFNGLLSEAVEKILLNQSDSNNDLPDTRGLSINEILRSISSEIRKFTYIIVRTIPLMVLFVVPIIQVFAPFIWFLFAAWVMALEYLEYPLGNRGIVFADVRALISQHRTLSMGFGMGISFLTMVPLINFVVMPVAVAGATKLYLDKLK